MGILDRCESRQGKAVRLLAVHSTEGDGTAAGLRDAAWWEGSSHALADAAGTLLTPAEGMVPYDKAAWTIRSANHESENIELVGWARWTRAEWLARRPLLDACARWLAARSKARNIPLVHLSLADVNAGKAGVIGHVDWTMATKLAGHQDGTHTDPGPNFPWDVVLDQARAYASTEDFLSALSTDEQRELLTHVRDLRSWARGGDPKVDNFTLLWQLLTEVKAMLRGGNTPPENNFHWLAKEFRTVADQLTKTTG